MRIIDHGPDIPPPLVKEHQDGKVVFDYDALLASEANNCWIRYPHALSEARKDKYLPKCIRYRLKILEEIVSFQFQPTDVAPYSGVCLNARIHPTPFERYSVKKLQELQRLSKTISDRKLSARINDVLWVSRKSLGLPNSEAVQYGEAAIRQLLDVPLDEKCWDFKIDVPNSIRGVRLALALRKNKYLEVFKDKIRKLFKNDRLFYHASEIVAEWKEPGLCKEAANLLVETAERLLSLGNPYDAITELKQARQLAQLTEGESSFVNEIGEKLFKAQFGLAEHLVKSGEKTLNISNRLEHAYAEWRNLPKNIKNRPELVAMAKQAKAQIAEMGLRAVNEMQTTVIVQRVESRLFPDFERVLQSDRTTLDKWRCFAALPFALDDTAFCRMKEEAKTSVDNSILRCFRRIRKASDGRTIARTNKPGNNLASDERERSDSFALADLYLARVNSLTPALLAHLRALRKAANLNRDEFGQLIQPSTWIPSGHLQQISLAIYHGAQENWIETMHILAPQVEAIVRRRLKEAGVSTIGWNDGVSNELGMSSLVKFFPKIISSSLAFEIQSLFCNHEGKNLRNDIAHGLRNDSDFTSSNILYAWWLTLHLLLCEGNEQEANQ